MSPRIILIFLAASLIFARCSGDKIDKQPPKATKLAPPQVETAQPATSSPSAQDLQPDVHISGTQNTHISGALSTSKHISGQ
jgi:hypothetical protein